MMDLATRYMGLPLKNPLVASASSLTGDLDSIRRLEDSGAAAVVLPSLFQEEIEALGSRHQPLAERRNGLAATSDDLSALAGRKLGPSAYLDLVRQASAAVDIPVIASLNGVTDDGWTSYARMIEQAGAKALELNIYFIAVDLGASGRDVEGRYLDILRSVRRAVSIPVAVKLSPYFSAVGSMALALQAAGADALVLFNRFYQPDLDLSRLQVVNNLKLSGPNEIRLPLLWLAALSGEVTASLAGSTGVSGTEEVVKYLLVGADVVMTTSALLRHGASHMAVLLAGLERWLDMRGYASLDAIRGILNRRNQTDLQAFERANYVKILQEYGTRKRHSEIRRLKAFGIA